MRFLATFQFYDFADTIVSLATAFVLGTLIGAERQYRQRTAGLRTNVLVALAAAAFVDLAVHINGADGAVRVIAYVVAGIGFLGAGAIMKEGNKVQGLNTAATLWGSAAVGACAGADMVAQAVLLTIFIFMTNTLLRPLVNAINRLPVDERASEATYEVRLTTDVAAVPKVREMLEEKLDAAKYPVSEIEEIERTDDIIELVAVLMSTSVESKELDAVTNALATQPGVRHATWSVRTVE
jgi:putative Mg2+ transporter-C (MgtC) family protein